MINTVALTGRLTNEPDARETSNGNTVVNFNLAVDRNFKNQNGEREADFINCTAFRKTAEIMRDYCHKGSLIGVEGRIQTRNYENKEGNRVYVTEVIVNNFSFLGSTKNSAGGFENNQSEPQSDPFADNGSFGDDDLPF